jgi:hypothetical protein
MAGTVNIPVGSVMVEVFDVDDSAALSQGLILHHLIPIHLLYDLHSERIQDVGISR